MENKNKKTSKKETAAIIAVYIVLFALFPRFFIGAALIAVAAGFVLWAVGKSKGKNSSDTETGPQV